jgi:hypothetical protein
MDPDQRPITTVQAHAPTNRSMGRVSNAEPPDEEGRDVCEGSKVFFVWKDDVVSAFVETAPLGPVVSAVDVLEAGFAPAGPNAARSISPKGPVAKHFP